MRNTADALSALEHGPSHRFAHWPNPDVPRVAVGVYTVWDSGRLIYVGMAGSKVPAGDVDPLAPQKPTGLWSRLDAHARGGRSGDQFCIYVCDRFVVPFLTAVQRTHLVEGTRPPKSRRSLLDDLTRTYIRDRYEYRFTRVPDVETARALEKQIRGGVLTAGKPDLNPL